MRRPRLEPDRIPIDLGGTIVSSVVKSTYIPLKAALGLPLEEIQMLDYVQQLPYVDEALLDKVVALPEHRQASRQTAQRSMVLLRNEGGLLPLSKNLKNVAVIGPLADSMDATEGSWMVFGYIKLKWNKAPINATKPAEIM